MIRPLLPALLLAVSLPATAADPLPAPLPDDAVLRTLAEGDAALASGDHAALLDSAQTLQALGATPAEGQDDLASQWAQEASAHGVTRAALAFRGRALGPAYRRGSLAAGSRFSMRQLFLAGQRAQISVASAGRGALSVRVTDAEGGTLCDKPVGAPQADCAWLPVFTDRYDIVIQNGGATTTAFYLILR